MVFKLKTLRKDIKTWVKEEFCSIKEEKKDLLDKLLFWEKTEEDRQLEAVEQKQKQSVVVSCR